MKSLSDFTSKLVAAAALLTLGGGCASNVISPYDISSDLSTWELLGTTEERKNLFTGKRDLFVYHRDSAVEGPEGVWNFYMARRTNAPLGQTFYGNAWKSTLNCNSQTMTWSGNPTHESWVAVADRVFCVRTRARQKEQERRTREFAEERERLRREVAKEQSEGLRRSIDDAKTTCKNLGFVEGTEKFGSCVLEVSK